MKFKVRLCSAGIFAMIYGWVAVFNTSCSTTCCKKNSAAPNTLTPQEQAVGWRLLWDGKTTAGWHSPISNEFPDKSWIIQNGELSVVSSGNAESQAGGDIITRDRFSNFDLVMDFKITTGCNSGIKIFVQPDISPVDPKTGQKTAAGSAIGMEFQILDDEHHPDAKFGRDGNRRLGSLYDLLPAPVDKKVMPIGEWNHARILSQGKHVEFWLNGEKTVEFERGSPEFRAAVAQSKFKKYSQFWRMVVWIYLVARAWQRCFISEHKNP